MTDIEFHVEGGSVITEYWYLLPPYQKAIAGDSNLDGVTDNPLERLLQNVIHLEGVDDASGQCRVNNAVSNTTDQSSCDHIPVLEDFHIEYVIIQGSSLEVIMLERYMLTYDNFNGYTNDSYNRGNPSNYGPDDNNPTTIEHPNGYGVTNLSHYDPNNFW